MDLQAARKIIDLLALGIHPVTGEVMPEDSPYNAVPVIRALLVVSRALDAHAAPAAKARREPPPNAGKPWAAEDDARLQEAFEAGIDAEEVARELGRTLFAVESRLVKLGKLPPKPGMRVESPVARYHH